MATNNLTSNTTDKVLRKFIPAFESDCVSAKTVNRQMVSNGDFTPQFGDEIRVKRPTQFRAEETPDGDLTSATSNDLVVGNAKAVVQPYISVWTDWKNVEEALELDQLDELLAPMATRAATTLEKNLNRFMLENSAHQLGTAGTALGTWDEVAKVDAFSHEFGFPAEVMVQINSFDKAALASEQKELFSEQRVISAWERARITKNVGGTEYFRSNTLPVHNAGTFGAGALTLGATPTQTYVSVKDSYETTLVISGLPASQVGALKAGDVIQVTQAGRDYLQQDTKETLFGEQGNPVKYTATVTADADSDGSGDATVVVAGPAVNEANGQFNTIASALASGDTVEVISGASATSNKPNLFYHKDAFGLAFVKLPVLRGGVVSSVASSSKLNVSMRATFFADGLANKQNFRIDLLPAFAVYNPLLAGRFFGGATPNS